ncbi:MAG: chemotaxis protein CheA [Syntrophorhabdales bacterium]|jgi:two-component system chemotaxis sensor kinase CheA
MEDQLIGKDELEEIIGEFITETVELVDGAIRDLVSLEEDPSCQAINSVFRTVHTIKGTSGFLGFNTLTDLAHRTEDVLGKLRKGDLSPNADIVNAILKSLDVIKLLVEDISKGDREVRDTSRLLAELEGIAEKKHLAALDAAPVTRNGHGIGKETGSADMEEVTPKEPSAAKGQASFATIPREEQTVRVDVRKLDELMNLVGELVLGKNRLMLLYTLLQENESLHPVTDFNIRGGTPTNTPLASLAEGTRYIEMITNDLQTAVMRARLVPISRLFNKVPRLVRDVCSASGKEVQLIIEGGETELDKSLIETLHDPLTHILRNSIDHGIESPQERVLKGKEAKGLISLKARGEGNQVTIEILDDGKGIDVKAIKEKVVEKGLMQPAEVERITAEEAINYIFVPGFSTARELTSISGRGVGMDVVKTNVERMNGRVYVDSKKGKWTRLTITLPLTLAIMKALLVSVGDEIYAVPLDVVLEVIKPKEGLVKTVQGHEVLVLRDLIIPLVRLSEVVSGMSEPNEKCSVILCKTPDRPIGLRVGSVVGQEEVVIKSLGEFLKSVRWIAGATIRGDGRVVLMLDLPGVFAHFCKQPVAA